MGGTPCKKILLNGRNAADLIRNAVELVEGEAYVEGDEKIIAYLNDLEDRAVEVQKMILKGIGYDGPVGKMLK